MRCAQANLNNLLLSVVYLLVAGLQQRVWGARLAARLTVRCPGVMRCRHTCKGRLTGCSVDIRRPASHVATAGCLWLAGVIHTRKIKPPSMRFF